MFGKEEQYQVTLKLNWIECHKKNFKVETILQKPLCSLYRQRRKHEFHCVNPTIGFIYNLLFRRKKIRISIGVLKSSSPKNWFDSSRRTKPYKFYSSSDFSLEVFRNCSEKHKAQKTSALSLSTTYFTNLSSILFQY